jgi:peptide/nickel transport system permease protein
MTIALGANLLIEASLAFLGMVSSQYPDWGLMLNSGALGTMEQAPWLAVVPGLAITIIVFAYSMFGDALRDMLDPKLRGIT